MSGKNKIYLALIALGLVALGLDRFYFGATSPSSSLAAETNDTDDDAENVGGEPSEQGGSPPAGRDQRTAARGPTRRPAVAVASVTAPPGVPELRFPRNLPPLESASDIRDVFARPGAKSPLPKPGAGGSGKSGAGPGASEDIGHAQFVAKHTLGALMVVEGLKIAVVSGRWLRVGDTLDGCTVLRIEGDSAVFACPDGEAEFSMSPRRSQPRD